MRSPDREWDSLISRGLDERLGPHDLSHLEHQRREDSALDREWRDQERIQRTLRDLEPAPLSPGFAARVLARDRFSGTPVAARPRRWLRVAAALVVLVALSVTYKLGMDHGRDVQRSLDSVPLAQSSEPLPAPIARAARLTLSDVAMNGLIPVDLRRPLLSSQIKQFGLAAWAERDEGKTARFIRSLDRALEVDTIVWDQWSEKASEPDLWREIRDREKPSTVASIESGSGTLRAGSTPGPDQWGDVLLTMAPNLAPDDRSCMVEVLVHRADFVRGRTPSVLNDQERLRALLSHERPGSVPTLRAPVSNLVFMSLAQEGYPLEAQQFLLSWFPEGRYPQHQRLLRELPLIARPRRVSSDESSSAVIEIGSTEGGNGTKRIILRVDRQPD